MNGIDSSGIHILEEIVENCREQQINFYLAGIKGPIRDILHRSGLTAKIGEDNFFFRIQHAVDFYDKKQPYGRNAYALHEKAKK